MIKKLRNIDWRDVLTRASRTFIQAFTSSISINVLVASDQSTFKDVLFSMLIGAVAAGLSATWNMILASMERREADEDINIDEKQD